MTYGKSPFLLWAGGVTRVEKGMNSHKVKLGESAGYRLLIICFQTVHFKLLVITTAVYVLEDCIIAFIMCWLLEKWAEYLHHIP